MMMTKLSAYQCQSEYFTSYSTISFFFLNFICFLRNSLIVLYGPPRYQWEHCVLREDIDSRRVCIAYREFTPMFLAGGYAMEIGRLAKKNSKWLCQATTKFDFELFFFNKRNFLKIIGDIITDAAKNFW
jgi:hypothetical protein